jgi:hypothetical protein
MNTDIAVYELVAIYIAISYTFSKASRDQLLRGLLVS